MLNRSSLEATLKHSLNLTFYELRWFQLISCKHYKHILEIKNLIESSCFCFRLMLLRLMMCWTSMILVIALNIHNFCWFFCVHFHMHLGACKIELCRYYFHVSRASTHEFILCKFVELCEICLQIALHFNLHEIHYLWLLCLISVKWSENQSLLRF